MSESFGQKLQRWREAAHLSQAELARRMDVSRNYVSNLERDFSPTAKGGKPQPSAETCDKIARALGVKIADVRLAAGYAPPKGGDQNEEAKEIEAQAARAAEMMDYFLRLSPERQAQALAMIKILQPTDNAPTQEEKEPDPRPTLPTAKITPLFLPTGFEIQDRYRSISLTRKEAKKKT